MTFLVANKYTVTPSLGQSWPIFSLVHLSELITDINQPDQHRGSDFTNEFYKVTFKPRALGPIFVVRGGGGVSFLHPPSNGTGKKVKLGYQPSSAEFIILRENNLYQL